MYVEKCMSMSTAIVFKKDLALGSRVGAVVRALSFHQCGRTNVV